MYEITIPDDVTLVDPTGAPVLNPRTEAPVTMSYRDFLLMRSGESSFGDGAEAVEKMIDAREAIRAHFRQAPDGKLIPKARVMRLEDGHIEPIIASTKTAKYLGGTAESVITLIRATVNARKMTTEEVAALSAGAPS